MKKEIKLNLVTFCLINAMNINIAEAQTEEILDQINVVEKNVWLMIKPFTEAKAKASESIVLKKPKLSIKLFEVSQVLLLNKIKALACSFCEYSWRKWVRVESILLKRRTKNVHSLR